MSKSLQSWCTYCISREVTGVQAPSTRLPRDSLGVQVNLIQKLYKELPQPRNSLNLWKSTWANRTGALNLYFHQSICRQAPPPQRTSNIPALPRARVARVLLVQRHPVRRYEPHPSPRRRLAQRLCHPRVAVVHHWRSAHVHVPLGISDLFVLLTSLSFSSVWTFTQCVLHVVKRKTWH